MKHFVWTMLVAISSAAFGFVTACALISPHLNLPAPVGDAVPAPAADPKFAAIGQSYLPALAKALASANEDGAQVLDCGGDVAAAESKIGASWAANRSKVYAALVVPELAKIVPAGVDPRTITVEQKAAMAAAYRGLAKGVAGP